MIFHTFFKSFQTRIFDIKAMGKMICIGKTGSYFRPEWSPSKGIQPCIVLQDTKTSNVHSTFITFRLHDNSNGDCSLWQRQSFLPKMMREFHYLSRLMTKSTKWFVHPAKTQISLGMHPVWSVFTVRLKKAWVLSNRWAHSKDSDHTGRMDSQADLNLQCAKRSFCWFCHVAAHFCSLNQLHIFLCLWTFLKGYMNMRPLETNSFLNICIKIWATAWQNQLPSLIIVFAMRSLGS